MLSIATRSHPRNHLHDTPTASWLRIWICAALLVAASASSLEACRRGLGFQPTVTDSKDLWYFWRHRVYCDDGKAIVFVGTSRIAADISLDTVRACLPGYRPIQLSLGGAASCIGLLQSLSEDRSFRGTIVCELDTPLLERTLWEGQADHRDYRPDAVIAYYERLARAWMDDNLSILRSDFTIKSTVASIFATQLPRKTGKFRRTFHREVQWNFAKVHDVKDLRRSTTEAYRALYSQHQFSTWTTISQDIPAINAMAQRLRGRGGRVVFIRAPSTGDRWRLEERFHSKKENWDRFVALTSATCIHFKDVADMRGLQCPDESHLDCRDSPRFTRALIRELLHAGSLLP